MTVSPSFSGAIPLAPPMASSGLAAVLLDPARFFGAVLSHRLLFLSCVAGFLALGAIAALVIPARYTATAVVLIDPRTPRVLRSEEVLPGIGNDAAAVESQVEFFTSTDMADRIIKQFDLMNDSEFSGPSISALLQSYVTGVEPGRELMKERAIDRFRRSLLVKRIKLTYVIEVNFISKSREKAAAIANAIVDAYVESQKATKVNATGEASAQIGQRLQDLRDKVRASEQAIADFKAANKIVSVGPGASNETLIQRQADSISSQLMTARARVSETASKLDQVHAAQRSREIESLTPALQSPVLGALRVQIAAAGRRVARLEALLGNSHPEMRSARRQLSELQAQAQAELSRIANNVKIEHQQAVDYEARLNAELDALQLSSAVYDQNRVKLQDLEREALANRTLYTQLLDRSKDTAEQANVQRADARVISRAITPISANPPSALLILVIAGALGCAAGGLAAARASVRRSARRAA